MGKIDDFSSKWLSRKYMAWIVSCIALFLGKITGLEWMAITIIYLFVQGVIDAKTFYELYKGK